MKQNLFNKLWLRVGMIVAIMTTALSGTAWAEKITDYSNIVSGTQYYIGATTGNTDYYLSVNGSSLSASIAGTAVTSQANATPFTFAGSGTSWTIQFESGYYLSLKSSKDNGKVQVVENATTFTASNQSGKLRLTTGGYSIQKNNSGTQFGSYANTQTDIWLEAVPSALACATPTFSPAAGAVVSGTEVTISSTEGATIYYTTDGTTPTSSSSVYSTPIEITSATTIKAFASKSGYDDSEVATAAYTIMASVSGYTIDFEDAPDAYVDWEFENIGTSNTAITAHGGSKYGANINDAGNGVSTASIQTKEAVALPGTITCYVSKTSNNTTTSTWTLSVSEDGTNWTEVATHDAKSMNKGEWVEFTANLSGYSDVYVRLSYGSSNAIRAIDDISITMRDPNAKITPTVTIDATGLTDDLAGSTNVSAGTVTATVTSGETTITTPAVTWSSSDTGVATVNATTGAVTLIAVGTTTITATFAGNDDYTEASATYELTVIDSNAKGQVNNPYTVAEALAVIDGLADNAYTATEVYVSGIISEINSQSSEYTSARYYISDDGTTAIQLYVYNGKYLNNENFTEDNQIQVNDQVVVYGKLQKYVKNGATTPEIAAGNYIYSLEREKTDPTINVSDASIAYGSTFTVSGIVGGDITVTSSNTAVATVSGLVITPIAVGTTTITVETAENDLYNAGSKTFELTVTQPEGQTTEPSAVGGTIFYESFDNCQGSGGNDNEWSGSIASNDLVADNTGWTFSNGSGANQCAKFGSSSKKGSATTPAISFLSDITYTLTFKAGAWNGNSEKTEGALVLTCSDTNATLSSSSFDLTKGEWTEFTVTITGASSGATLTFSAVQGSNNRFFLDEVKIEAPASAYTETYTIPSSGLGTYCSQYPIDLDELPEGVKAYAVTAKGESSVTLTEITGTIKGGVGFILEGSGDVTFTFADSSTEPTNLLVGTLAPEYLAEGTAYGLKSGVFQPNTAGTIKAHRAYLPADAGNAVKALTLIFEDDATGITHTRVITDEATIYDLTGRRLSQMQKGINIVNGKKILK